MLMQTILMNKVLVIIIRKLHHEKLLTAILNLWLEARKSQVENRWILAIMIQRMLKISNSLTIMLYRNLKIEVHSLTLQSFLRDRIERLSKLEVIFLISWTQVSSIHHLYDKLIRLSIWKKFHKASILRWNMQLKKIALIIVFTLRK